MVPAPARMVTNTKPPDVVQYAIFGSTCSIDSAASAPPMPASVPGDHQIEMDEPIDRDAEKFQADFAFAHRHGESAGDRAEIEVHEQRCGRAKGEHQPEQSKMLHGALLAHSRDRSAARR